MKLLQTIQLVLLGAAFGAIVGARDPELAPWGVLLMSVVAFALSMATMRIAGGLKASQARIELALANAERARALAHLTIEQTRAAIARDAREIQPLYGHRN